MKDGRLRAARTSVATRTRAVALLWVVAGLMAGCCGGGVKYEAGRAFNPKLLATSLSLGSSTKADVQALLGVPFGEGMTMMPYHDSPRATWTYFSDRGSVDMDTHRINDELAYLFVFFRDDRVDGYIWFDTQD